ncbi:hypothetical protein ACEPAH_2698 [Sanghuangporus vaninii]
MNTDLSATSSADQQTDKETQIHQQLQPGLENIVESQPWPDEQAQPQVHPVLDLQHQARVTNTNVPQQPEVQQVAFQPVPKFQPEEIQVLELPELEEPQQPEISQVAFQPVPKVQPEEVQELALPEIQEPQQPEIPQVAFQPVPKVQPEEAQVLALPELQESEMAMAAPQSSPQVQQAPFSVPVPAPIPGIYNPPEQAAEVFTSVDLNAGVSQPSDAVSELQQRASLAASRVQLMDATIDILVETFKNKDQLDKALEKRCSKLLKASVLETTDHTLKEDLKTLSNSIGWVEEQVQNLEECLHEKHRNMQLAGPLVNAKHEGKKEEKQIKSIEKAARKIQQRAMNRDATQMKKGKKQSEGKMIDEAWQQLHSSQ